MTSSCWAAGIVGAGTAYFLAEKGFRVLLIDGEAPAWGASGPQSGIPMAAYPQGRHPDGAWPCGAAAGR